MQSTVRNLLLRGMSREDFEYLAPYLEHSTLARSQNLQLTGDPVDEVYFIESGVLSAIAEGKNGIGAEAGQIGWDGMTGRSVVMGFGTSGVKIVTHVAGAAWRIKATHLSEAMDKRPSLRAILIRYLHTSDVQLSHTLLAACRARCASVSRGGC
jgi:CRP-like cAMP-binding protein